MHVAEKTVFAIIDLFKTSKNNICMEYEDIATTPVKKLVIKNPPSTTHFVFPSTYFVPANIMNNGTRKALTTYAISIIFNGSKYCKLNNYPSDYVWAK